MPDQRYRQAMRDDGTAVSSAIRKAETALTKAAEHAEKSTEWHHRHATLYAIIGAAWAQIAIAQTAAASSPPLPRRPPTRIRSLPDIADYDSLPAGPFEDESA